MDDRRVGFTSYRQRQEFNGKDYKEIDDDDSSYKVTDKFNRCEVDFGYVCGDLPMGVILFVYHRCSRWPAGAASRRASPGKLETETADDFVLQQTTVINRATITGLVPLGTPVENIKEVEVEVYHVFPLDSAPASGKVPSRVNSPSDVEIGTATRAGGSGLSITHNLRTDLNA